MQENKAAEAMSMLDLISIQKIFQKYDLSTAILEKSEILPLNSLVINTVGDYKKRTRTLSFSFLPLELEHFPDVKLLQIFSEFNFDIKKEYLKDLETLLVKLNRLLPIGCLGITEGNKVYLRYVHTLAKYDIIDDKESTLLNIYNLFVYALNLNAKVLELVATGEKSLEIAYSEFLK